MAPKPAKPAKESKELIPRAKREVIGQSEGVRLKPADQRPSTSRALVLRNGKFGARGTGELIKMGNKIVGQEKLELLAGMSPYPPCVAPLTPIEMTSSLSERKSYKPLSASLSTSMYLQGLLIASSSVRVSLSTHIIPSETCDLSISQ
jgi:hypothetical protein